MFRSILSVGSTAARPSPSRSFASACNCQVYFPKSSFKSKPASSAASAPSRTPSSKVPAPNSHLTPAEINSKKSDESNVDAGPPLPLDRPLGVAEPPTKGKQSREEWRKDLLDQSKRINERRHLYVGLREGTYDSVIWGLMGSF